MIDHLKAKWDNEYSRARIIPSSLREAPSQALLLFTELLEFRGMKRALDVGCGNGRNSLYLARSGLQVDSMDFSTAALDEASRRTDLAELRDSISFQKRNLEDVFPFEPESFDLCLDFYVFCHFLDDEMKNHYVSELLRVTKPGGYLITTLFSPNDEYYARLRKTSEQLIVEDPANGIVKELYTQERFRRSFSPPFDVCYSVTFEFDDVVQDKTYHRDILVMALQKSWALDNEAGR